MFICRQWRIQKNILNVLQEKTDVEPLGTKWMISFSSIHGAAGDAGSSEESKVAIEIESLDAQASVDVVESRHEQASKTAGWHLIGRTSDAHMFQNGFFQQAL